MRLSVVVVLLVCVAPGVSALGITLQAVPLSSANAGWIEGANDGTPVPVDGTPCRSRFASGTTRWQGEVGLRAQGKRLVLAMNPGMLREDYSPVGLYVEHGEELRPLNRARGDGSNFCLLPNGVFALSEDPVNFHGFATLFRDELHCGNALYLDGALTHAGPPAHRWASACFTRCGVIGSWSSRAPVAS